MNDAVENVHQEIRKLIPASIINDIACFVFYDNHPRDEKRIDIAVCTKKGEFKEFFQRDLHSSLNLNCVIEKPSELRILRNSNSELFYLLAAKNELFIISSKDKLRIHKKLTNVDRYDVNDTACSGETCLKVIRTDDAVPLLFDSNFESFELGRHGNNSQIVDDSLPILTELKRKLVEARYTTKCNEKTLSQYLGFHQNVSLLTYEKLQSVSNSPLFESDSKGVCGALKLQTQKPWVKVCNKKVAIILNVLSECKQSIENIQILLNNPTIPSLVYTTKLLIKTTTSPYWVETKPHILKSNQECAIVAVIDLDEIKLNITSRIELNGSISYMLSAQEYLLPFDDVTVSSLESMQDEFDVLSSCKDIHHNTIIAILAATENTELRLRHIKNINEPDVSMLDLFCTHLQMERVECANAIVYRKSPYHTLNGVLLIFHERNADNALPVSAHTRSPSQLLALLHYIYDAVPAKIIVTTPTNKISAKTDELSQYNEDIQNTNEDLDFTKYATSVLNRSAKILEHLDNSMIAMSESKNSSLQNKVGSQIDLFAGGVSTFKEFKQSILKEAQKGIHSLMKSYNAENPESNKIIVD